jgi:hypothetical protein
VKYLVVLVTRRANWPITQAIVEVRLEHQTSASVARFEKEILKYAQAEIRIEEAELFCLLKNGEQGTDVLKPRRRKTRGAPGRANASPRRTSGAAAAKPQLPVGIRGF